MPPKPTPKPTPEPEPTPLPADPRTATIAGIPYPLPTDPVAEGAAAIQAVANYFDSHGFSNTLTPKPQGTNANTLTETGNYIVDGAGNAPLPGWVVYEVIRFGGASPIYASQRAYVITDGSWDTFSYERRNHGLGWLPWHLVGRRIVAGVVRGDGSIGSGSGFTTFRWSPGHYRVSYNNEGVFVGGLPAILITPNVNRNVGGRIAWSYGLPTQGDVEVWIYDIATDGGVDSEFSFMIVQVPTGGPSREEKVSPADSV